MRIVLNAIWSNDEPCDGHTVYCHNIVKQILRLDKENQYLLYYYGQAKFDFLKAGKNVQSLSLERDSLIPRLLDRFRPYLWEEIRINAALVRFRPHILFQVGHWLDFVHYPLKKIHTIHDLAFLHSEYREYFPPDLLEELVDFTGPRVRQSHYLIAVSETTKRDIINYFQYPEERIAVIGHGFDDNIFNTELKERGEIYGRLGITRPFIVSVGVLQPRKNFQRLIRAFASLKNTHNIPHKLVIVGGRAWQYREIEDLPESLGIADDVVFTGFLPVRDLACLVKGSDLFVLPALYEGFGIPVIEAMACGIPVAASNVGSLPEVLGDAGLQFDPYSVDDIADKMHQVLSSTTLKEDLIRRGLERAESFSWERAARETIEVFKKASREGLACR